MIHVEPGLLSFVTLGALDVLLLVDHVLAVARVPRWSFGVGRFLSYSLRVYTTVTLSTLPTLADESQARERVRERGVQLRPAPRPMETGAMLDVEAQLA